MPDQDALPQEVAPATGPRYWRGLDRPHASGVQASTASTGCKS